MSDYQIPPGDVPGIYEQSKRRNCGIQTNRMLAADLVKAHAEIAALTKERDDLQSTLDGIDEEVSEVYGTLTCGKFSKCNTQAVYVIEAVQTIQQEEYADIEKERDTLKDVITYVTEIYVDNRRIHNGLGCWAVENKGCNELNEEFYDDVVEAIARAKELNCV